MNRRIYLLIVILIFTSCKDEKSKNLEFMKLEFIKYLEDNAFRDNAKLSVMEIKAISCDTLNENYIDTLKMNNNQRKCLSLQKRFDLTFEMVKLQDQQMRLASDLGNRTMMDISKEDREKYSTDAKELLDSVIHYIKLDSMITLRIKNRQKPEMVYQTRMYFKGTISKDGSSRNIMDTLYVHFDKKLKLIRLDM